jgi:hypothetical protein
VLRACASYQLLRSDGGGGGDDGSALSPSAGMQPIGKAIAHIDLDSFYAAVEASHILAAPPGLHFSSFVCLK